MAQTPERRPEDSNTDEGEATARPTGGDEGSAEPDANSTTGTTESDVFVGRAGGQDVGYAGETGAEARAQSDREQGAGDS